MTASLSQILTTTGICSIEGALRILLTYKLLKHSIHTRILCCEGCLRPPKVLHYAFKILIEMIFQESRFRSALKVLSTAPAAAANIDDVKMDEFVIAEQVKKFLVQLKYFFPHVL